jgi:hypothetical protein
LEQISPTNKNQIKNMLLNTFEARQTLRKKQATASMMIEIYSALLNYNGEMVSENIFGDREKTTHFFFFSDRHRI